MEVWYRLISLLIGYGFGLFQTAIVIGKIQGLCFGQRERRMRC